jgi:hemerythrin-like domain-containing protein
MTTADLTSYHVVHTALRRAPHRLAATAQAIDPSDRGRTAALARYWKGYAAEVLSHHTIEDVVFFPALVERVPETARHMARLGSEHHHLDALMTACTNAVEDLRRDPGADATAELASHFQALARLMDDHLEYEDVEILPLFQEHFSGEEYEALEQQAMKQVKMGPQAAFAVPFVVDAATTEQFTQLFAQAPAPLKVLYRVTRGRHARLAARALGAAAFATTLPESVDDERELVGAG